MFFTVCFECFLFPVLAFHCPFIHRCISCFYHINFPFRKNWIGSNQAILLLLLFYLQMAGCLVYYILSDGHIPHETTSPYVQEPEGVIKNIKAGKFHLDHLDRFSSFDYLISKMITAQQEDRPSIDDCILGFQGTCN